MDRYSEEEHLLPLPQQTAPQFHPITQPPQYGQPSVQVPVNAFTGPYQDFAHTGLHQHQPPYQHGSAGQMQQVVVVGQQQQQQPQVVVGRRTYDSYTWHIILSCIVFWCCGWVFGAIAFSLAVYANSYSASGHPEGARRLGKASIVVSVIGLVVGVVLITIFIILAVKEHPHGEQ